MLEGVLPCLGDTGREGEAESSEERDGSSEPSVEGRVSLT
jgi:hypothetical protein